MVDSESELDLLKDLRHKIRAHKACSGYGYVLKDDKKVMCECQKDALYQYRLTKSGIPPKFRSKGFKNVVYKEGGAYIKIQEYLANSEKHRSEGMGLYLWGSSATGKTLLSCSLLMELMKQGFDCRFLDFGGLLSSMRSDDRSEVAMIKNWDFLCIDDIDKVLNSLTNFREGAMTGEKVHGAVEALCSVLSMMANASRPAIITSRVPISKLNEKFPNLAGTLIGSYMPVCCEDKGFRARSMAQMMDGE